VSPTSVIVADDEDVRFIFCYVLDLNWFLSN
jgi:hypothetical protein